MADKDINIGIKTTGADAAAQSIRKVEDAAEDLAKAQTKGFGGMLDAGNSLPSREVQAANEAAARSFAQVADKARVAEFAYYDLGAEMRKTEQTTQTFTSGQTRVQSSTRNSAQALYIFSQGVEDAAYGLRGILNNIPQLVLAMGGTAGLAGVVSLSAVALSQIIPLFTETEEKASDLAERIQETADNMAALDAERFEAIGEGIDFARDRAAALKQEFDDTRAAEAQFSTAALDNAGKLAEAQRNVAEALGSQVDRYKELQAIADADAEKRRLAAEQAITAEQQKLDAANEAVTVAADYLGEQKNRAALEQANLVSLRAQLDTLYAQKAALEKISEQRDTDDPGLQLIGAFFPKAIPRTEAGAEAFKQSKDPVFLAKLEGTQQKVNQLEGLVENLLKDGGIVTRAENAFLAAQTQLTDLTSAVATNIERIETTLAADNLLARTETVVQASEQRAKDLEAAVTQIETTNSAGEAAKQTIQQAAADGKITADESQRVAQATAQLIGQIQAGVANAGANTQQVLGLLRTLAEQEARNGRAIRDLQAQINQLFARIR